MAQQLSTLRSPAAYEGVRQWARSHQGEASAAAYLALGHAYLADKRYPDAIESFNLAMKQGHALDDYATYLSVQAYNQSGRYSEALKAIDGFADKYPESIFTQNLPVLEAQLQLGTNDPQGALHTLTSSSVQAVTDRADFQFTLARAYQANGDTARATEAFRHIYTAFPLKSEAAQAKTQLQLLTGGVEPNYMQREEHANALFASKRYADAESDFRSLAADPAADAAAKNHFLAQAAFCDMKHNRHVNKAQVELLEDRDDDSGAERLYLLMEEARDRQDTVAQHGFLDQLTHRFSKSHWREEALFSSGNMYLLRKEYSNAVPFFLTLAEDFPQSTYAPYAHWKAAWLSYRQRDYATAARLFDEQIRRYSGGQETPAALYWRARIYEEHESNPSAAMATYRSLVSAYQNFYYADLARERIAKLGSVSAASLEVLKAVPSPKTPTLDDVVPEEDGHLVKARLLANAGLNEYILEEIQASPDSANWSGYALAQIYASFGEIFHAMRVMKGVVPFAFSVDIDKIPRTYWGLLFPEPYWSELVPNAQRNGLDPFLVASLIRQESEFNPNAISPANAYGLMQLLPRVGEQIARQQGEKHLSTFQLLDPATNLRLGTVYLKQMIDQFGGQVEYALAAYNAGDSRVADWQSAGGYQDMPEFVESIPFTETREYVQAILRNWSMYKRLHPDEAARYSGR